MWKLKMCTRSETYDRAEPAFVLNLHVGHMHELDLLHCVQYDLEQTEDGLLLVHKGPVKWPLGLHCCLGLAVGSH